MCVDMYLVRQITTNIVPGTEHLVYTKYITRYTINTTPMCTSIYDVTGELPGLSWLLSF